MTVYQLRQLLITNGVKLILTLTLILTNCQIVSSQNIEGAALINSARPDTYAYITVEGKGFGKKLKVEVDLGDTPEQVNVGKEYSETLTNKKSYAAVLNYMAEKQYELIESRDYTFSFQGTDRIFGIIFIMRKKINITKKE
jgi:hypothetical protein